jgi:hypothetical protein
MCTLIRTSPRTPPKAATPPAAARWLSLQANDACRLRNVSFRLRNVSFRLRNVSFRLRNVSFRLRNVSSESAGQSAIVHHTTPEADISGSLCVWLGSVPEGSLSSTPPMFCMGTSPCWLVLTSQRPGRGQRAQGRKAPMTRGGQAGPCGGGADSTLRVGGGGGGGAVSGGRRCGCGCRWVWDGADHVCSGAELSALHRRQPSHPCCLGLLLLRGGRGLMRVCVRPSP